MRSQTIAKKDSAAALTPKVRPTAAWRVKRVKALPGFRLHVRFVDGLEGYVDMSAFVRSRKAGVFALLADPKRFRQVHVKVGAVTWPGELDLAPDAMYDKIKQTGEWKLGP